MSDRADKIAAGLTEAVAIVAGEQPAPRIHMYGHAYVPETALRASEERADGFKQWLDRLGETLDAISGAVPEHFLLDPPDGGDVTTLEGVTRVVAALEAAEARVVKLEEALRSFIEYGRYESGGAYIVRVPDQTFHAARAALEDKP